MGLKEKLSLLAERKTIVVLPADTNPLDELLYVKKLTLGEQQDWQSCLLQFDQSRANDIEKALRFNPGAVPDQVSKFLVRVLCDADGKRVFEDHDWPTVSNIEADIAAKLYHFAAGVNGMLDTDEDLEKN